MNNKVTRIFRQIIVIICCLSIVLPSCNLDIPNNTKKDISNFNSKGFRDCYYKYSGDFPVMARQTVTNSFKFTKDGDSTLCTRSYTDTYTSNVDVHIGSIGINGDGTATLYIFGFPRSNPVPIVGLSAQMSVGNVSGKLSSSGITISGTITGGLTTGCGIGKQTITFSGTASAPDFVCDNSTGGHGVGAPPPQPPPPPNNFCKPSSSLSKADPSQEFVSPKDGNGINDTMELLLDTRCANGSLEIKGFVSDDNSNDPIIPKQECVWMSSGPSDKINLISWNGKCDNNTKYMANGLYTAKFTSLREDSVSIVPVEVRNGGDEEEDCGELFVFPYDIKQNLQQFGLGYLLSDDFGTKSFNAEFTHRSINELLEIHNEIKVLDNKISSLSARNLSTTSLDNKKLALISQRNTLKQNITNGLLNSKSSLRSFANFIMKENTFSVDSTNPKPTTIDEYKTEIEILEEYFTNYTKYNTSFDLITSTNILADENQLLISLVNDLISDEVVDLPRPSNIDSLNDFDAMYRKSELVKYLSELISHHQDVFGSSFKQLNETFIEEGSEYYDQLEDLDKFTKLVYIYGAIKAGKIDPETFQVLDPNSFSAQSFKTKGDYDEAFFDFLVRVSNSGLAKYENLNQTIAKYQDEYGYEPALKFAVDKYKDFGYSSRGWGDLTADEKKELVKLGAELGSFIIPREGIDFIGPAGKALSTAKNVTQIPAKVARFRHFLGLLNKNRKFASNVATKTKINPKNGKKVFVQYICGGKCKPKRIFFDVEGSSKTLLKNLLAKTNPPHFQKALRDANPNSFMEFVDRKDKLTGKIKKVWQNMPANHIFPAGHKQSERFMDLFKQHGITAEMFNVNSAINAVIIPEKLNLSANTYTGPNNYFKKVEDLVAKALEGKTGNDAKIALEGALTDLAHKMDADRVRFQNKETLQFFDWYKYKD